MHVDEGCARFPCQSLSSLRVSVVTFGPLRAPGYTFASIVYVSAKRVASFNRQVSMRHKVGSDAPFRNLEDHTAAPPLAHQTALPSFRTAEGSREGR